MFIKIILIILFSSSLLSASEYFVRFSLKGQQFREEITSQKWEKIPSLNTLEYSTPPVHSFKKIQTLHDLQSKFAPWYVLDLEDGNPQFLNTLMKDNLIDFYEPVGYLKVDFLSADSLSADQWYLDKIDLQQAWGITKGSPNIIVAVIDTGIDFEHPDLRTAIWINDPEDLNNNGILDAQDLNNIDDDGNGFVDDVIGWDFTDAPRFADGGDFKDPDNIPQDEYGTGHGTQIAGIIAATDNNQIGITGIAPNVKVMNIRAGTAAGYLEEDDVARAILYAVDNGAQIINMSFGDVVLSRFLKDVIQYAYEKNIIMVASSGNSSTDEVHFPSGLPETISVGASTESDMVAGFSNFGNTLDLVAPGTNILSTAAKGKYNTVNGTSFSAPIISAVAALLLSKNPQLTKEQVRNILRSTTRDILDSGWDEYSGNGRVSALNAMQIPFGGSLKINKPAANSSTANFIQVVTGSIAHPDLKSSVIDYGIGKKPVGWHILRETEGKQISNDTLAMLDISGIADTSITVRLRMNLFNNLLDETRSTFYIDRSAPQIRDINLTKLWDGAKPSILISFTTDDICTSDIKIREINSGTDFFSISSQYETQNHVIKIDADQLSGPSEFYILCQNKSGLVSIDDNNDHFYPLVFDGNFQWTSFNEVPWTLPPGFMLYKTTDFDNDGNLEIAISRYDADNAFGPVEIYEFNNGEFVLSMRTDFTAIPRDAGDVDGDGRNDLLLGFGQHSFLLESKDANSFPTEVVWQDTVNFWAAAYTDLDNDRKYEITGRIENEYVLLENTGDNIFAEIARLGNPTSGQNLYGVPEIELTDLTGDSVKEIIFGDYDGDLISYTSSGDNQFQMLATGKTINANATEIITSDNNGHAITATHPLENSNYEHEFDARFWTIEIFNRIESAFVSTATLNTFGFSPVKEFDSGLSFYSFNGKSYLFAALFPQLYVFEYAENQWQPVWLFDQARSNTVLVADFDKDGQQEFYLNDGYRIKGFSASAANRPAAPLFFRATAKDSTTISLSWQEVPGIMRYNLYRGDVKNDLLFLDEVSENSFTDSNLQKNKKYYYTVTAIDSSNEIYESYFSNIDSAQTEYPPKVISINFVNDHQLLVNFDSKIKLLESNPASAFTKISQAKSSSIIVTNPGQNLLISFAQTFIENMQDTLILSNVFGEYGTNLDKRSEKTVLNFMREMDAPYIVETSWLSHFELQIEFSEAMLESDLINPQNYSVQPGGSIKKIETNNDFSKVTITFDNKTLTGPTGQSSFLLLQNMHSQAGAVLSENNTISLYRESIKLKNVVIYPQPVEPHHKELIFSNLPGDVSITVFSLSGQPVKTISQNTFYGGVKWDLRDNAGAEVAGGIYFYNLKWQDKQVQGKIVIIR